nr:aldo/keto reductase [Bradyrhizobium sp. SZCCHNRI2014]
MIDPLPDRIDVPSGDTHWLEVPGGKEKRPRLDQAATTPVKADGVGITGGRNIPQVALNWLLQRPTVATIIVGARNESQLIETIGAVGWSLTAEQVATLDAANDTPAAYPVWHRRGFPMLNERR